MQRKRADKKPAKNAWRGPGRAVSIAAFLWLLFSAFFYVWCGVQVTHLGYRLSKAHRQHSQLLNDNKKLRLELARLKAPERIERIAVRQLGLRHPKKNQVVMLP